MNLQHGQQVLYDLALAIAGEPELERLTRTFLQRLLYHTGFAGAVLVRLEGEAGTAQARLIQAVGDRGMRQRLGGSFAWPAQTLHGGNALLAAAAFPVELQGRQSTMPHLLRLEAGAHLRLFLFAQRLPHQPELLVSLFDPILLRFARAFELSARAEEQKAQLIAAKEEAERASQAKSDFLSSMSHEFRTPMNAILGFAQILEFDERFDDEQQDSIHEILKAGHHLLDLINEVLDLAKIEAGRIDLSLEPVVVDELVEECYQLLRPLAMVRRITLGRQAPTAALVRADRVRLKQVLLNLLSNAIKYNRDGGHVTLAVERAAAGQLRLLVRDTGAGIAAERLGELFQPFSRLGAEQGEVEGTGIGLTITRRLVELMGGAVGVESGVGVGSTFWLDLPEEFTAQGTAVAEADHRLTAPVGAGKRVLYIEDNPVNLKLVSQILSRLSHIRLITAHTPGLGIELALAHQPDLILLDINMPGMDGYQVLSVLQGEAQLKGIPVIAVTASAMPRDIARGKAAGFDEYLTKPLDARHFMATVERWLSAAPRQIPRG